MVTALQQEQIRRLRSQGAGYRQIAGLLNLDREDVRYCCKKLGLDGKNTIEVPEAAPVKEPDTEICKYCGSELIQPQTGRKKQFCCDACRRKWWNQNRSQIQQNPTSIYGYTCKRCGKEFTAYGNSHRQYCCYECFISDRYWGGKTPTKTKVIAQNTVPTVVMIS